MIVAFSVAAVALAVGLLAALVCVIRLRRGLDEAEGRLDELADEVARLRGEVEDLPLAPPPLEAPSKPRPPALRT